ncbi:carboxylesterase/lipase family protein [Saccharomonospora saliphila]|uniref:carboxylesterase/lipase family protein n=1 Tax=Saccharomonospora saliphila TaxID=369829 RepID=UPI000662528C|nr:carboxylesterase family protein [Saccharomonospora saliphila]
MIAKTEYGAVRGSEADGLAVFKGIPFAAPLDGPRRFLAPQPPEPWTDTREAVDFSAPTPQGTMMEGMPSLWRPGCDTDCLTVNVWTPEPGGSGLPVLVYLYGGAFLVGSSSEPTYDGTRLARDGVVVVTVNYRVGYEGFGWVADAPANRALLDQLAALRWVRDNIAGFGGDADNVTVFGESAGATAVAALLSAPRATGLFRRAIAQSVAGRFLDRDEARRMGESIAAEVGTRATVEELAAVPPEEIHRVHKRPLARAVANGESSQPEGITPYAFVLDDDTVPRPPWHALRAGSARGVEVIWGFNRDEYTLFTLGRDLSSADPGAAARALGLGPSAVDDYRAAHPGITDADLYTLLFSDAVFRMPTTWCADAHASAGGRSFLYELTWPSPAMGGALRACHALDLPLTFGNFDTPVRAMVLGESVPEEAHVLSREMRRAWVSFAGTGDPGWPAYDAERALTRIWDVPPSVAPHPEQTSRRIWASKA